MVSDGDLCESRFESIVSFRFLSDLLESLEVRRELTFSDVEADTGPVTELFDYVEQGYHVINGIGDQGAIIGIPLARESEAARRDVVTLLRGVEPADDRFNHEVEQ